MCVSQGFALFRLYIYIYMYTQIPVRGGGGAIYVIPVFLSSRSTEHNQIRNVRYM